MARGKKDYYPSSILAMISMFCGITCILTLLIMFISGYPADVWLDRLIYGYLFFFSMGILFGVYSLFIQRNSRAWTAVVVGLLFIILSLIALYLLSQMCVVC
ncbi:MAG: hypothetical protein ACTHZ7_13090 [Sphingobacterium sp.]